MFKFVKNGSDLQESKKYGQSA